MKMYVRPVDQGQIVTVSYGYDSRGNAYRRTFDASDRTEVWERGELDWDLEPEGEDQNHIPCVIEWVLCDPPGEEDE